MQGIHVCYRDIGLLENIIQQQKQNARTASAKNRIKEYWQTVNKSLSANTYCPNFTTVYKNAPMTPWRNAGCDSLVKMPPESVFTTEQPVNRNVQNIR